MDSIFLLELCLHVHLLMLWSLLVLSQQICDQTHFLHSSGSCLPCPVCGPGEQLSEDCGFGDGGGGVCVLCEDGKFSSETSVAPCSRCTSCNLLNRLETQPCFPGTDTQCGGCLPGFYELRSRTGNVELSCIPCSIRNVLQEECSSLASQNFKAGNGITSSRGNFKEPEEKRVKEDKLWVIVISSATAFSLFLLVLLLWMFLMTADRFKQVPESGPDPGPGSEGLLSTADVHNTTDVPLEDPPRGQNSASQEKELHPTSIVINVTTNFKPSRPGKDNTTQGDHQSSFSNTEMEQKLQTIWEMAQDHGVDVLDYDSVQDLSLLLDSADKSNTMRRLGRSLGVPPQVIAHLQGFQDLFQYLRTSTYTLLPQLAQAAALLPSPEVVSRIHKAVVNQ